MATPNMRKIAKFCDSRGFVVFSFERIGMVDGKKKLIGLPSDWANCKKLDIHENHECFGIVTGKRSGITVIDCDTKSAYDSIIRDYPELGDSLTIETFKGCHIYCKYDSRISNDSHVFSEYPGVDIRNDGGFVIAPWSSYTPDESVFTYKVSRDRETVNYPADLRPSVAARVKVKPKTQGQLTELCDIIDIKYLDNRQSWYKIIMSLRAVGAPKEYIRNLSVKSSKYTEQGFEEAYDSYNPAKAPKNKFGIPDTICFYSRNSNQDEYIKIMSKYHKFNGPDDIKIINTLDHLFGDGILYNNGHFYVYNGRYWQRDHNNQAITNIISEDLCSHYSCCLSFADEEEKKLVRRAISKCQNSTGINNITRLAKARFSNMNIKFESNPFVFCFTDKIYDFKNESWIDSTDRDDYMYLTTGYEYRKPTQAELKEVHKIIDSIFPVREIRDCYLSILATGMLGRNPELFVMAEGAGGNGKGLINDLMSSMLGNGYYRPLDVNILSSDLKPGANPAIASLRDARLAICREPKEGNLSFPTIKALTGGDEITGRDLFSSEMATPAPITLIMECNMRPGIPGTIGNDIKRRLVDIPFTSTFTDDEKLLCQAGYFPKDSKFKETSFKNNHRAALFEILRPFAIQYIKLGRVVIPDAIKAETFGYLEKSNIASEWFLETYERDEVGHVKVIDALKLFREEYVRTTQDKKKYSSKEKFLNYLSIENLGYFSGAGGGAPAVFLGWKRKASEGPVSCEL
jgi:phage/plasmid-associated DNA primase